MTIGENIRKYRKKRGLSQKELGELLGMTKQMIDIYESGKRNTKLDSLRNIANVLNVTVADLDSSLLPESTTRTMRDYMDMKGKPLTEYFDAWLKVCEIEWDEVERNGKKGRLFRFEGLESFGEDEKEYFVTEAQFKKIRNGEVHFVKDKVQEYDDMNRSEEE